MQEGVAQRYETGDLERWVPEPPKRANRTAFARDRARVLHSAAWRRLAAKTQVLSPNEADFPRTRMTHSLECAQVGRELGEALGCDPDLVEAACLAHDLGHPPFGHNGEDALEEFCGGVGGFEGNAQTLRILTRLEAKAFGEPDGSGHPRPIGLNLTRAALDAATKYPWLRQPGSRKFGVYNDDKAVFEWMRVGAPQMRRSFEAQVMDWSDDVAYSVHDLEDGIHAGYIDPATLRDPEVAGRISVLVATDYLPEADPDEIDAALGRVIGLPQWPTGYSATLRDLAALKSLTSTLIGRFTSAAHRATREAHAAPALTRFSASLQAPGSIRLEVAVLKAVVNLFVMQRSGSNRAYQRQRTIILELAGALLDHAPDVLEPHIGPSWTLASDDGARLRVVADQVASLTDTSVVSWHARLCG